MICPFIMAAFEVAHQSVLPPMSILRVRSYPPPLFLMNTSWIYVFARSYTYHLSRWFFCSNPSRANVQVRNTISNISFLFIAFHFAFDDWMEDISHCLYLCHQIAPRSTHHSLNWEEEQENSIITLVCVLNFTRWIATYWYEAKKERP